MTTIKEIITQFVLGNKAGSIDGIKSYAKARNIGVGDVFRKIGNYIEEWTNSSSKETSCGYKHYVDMTVYYANNEDKFVASVENKTISLEPRTVFGNQLYYPNCEASRLIMKLMNQKAFTPQQVERMDRSDCFDIIVQLNNIKFI